MCCHEAEVALGQQWRTRIVARRQARQRTKPVGIVAQAGAQHIGMALARHAVGQHAGPGQALAVVAQAVDDGAQRAAHGASIDHREHGHAEALGQVGHAVLAVEQAHDAFDQDQISLARGGMQACGAVGGARHP